MQLRPERRNEAGGGCGGIGRSMEVSGARLNGGVAMSAADEKERLSQVAELADLQEVIRLTKMHVDALTVTFAKYKTPPSQFLSVS